MASVEALAWLSVAIMLMLILLFSGAIYFFFYREKPEKSPTPGSTIAEAVEQAQTPTKKFPAALKTAIALIIIGAIIWFAVIPVVIPFLGNLGDSSSKNSVNKYSEMPKSSSIATNADNSITITMTGKEPNGVSTGITLAPGESVKVKHLSGKIVCDNKKGFTYPIWGVPIEKTHPGWIPYLPYAEKGIWTNAVCIILQGENEEIIYPFRENSWQVTAKNIAGKPRKVILYFHDARGYYNDNEGNAKFLIKKI